VRVQHILHEELNRAIADFNGIGGAGIILDLKTGEVLSLVSLPDFDPARPGEASDDTRFDRATLGLYEMGSVFKIFTAAMALDSGTVNLKSGFDASQPIHISRFTISDYHAKNRWLSVPEIFMYSSNIGAAKMALAVGTDTQRAFLNRLGMLHAASLELPEIGKPEVPSTWREINTMTIAFGHGISVSPLQCAVGVNAIVDGGILIPPTLVKRDDDNPALGPRVIKAETSATLRKLMRLVVEEGTGKNADVPGYRVGGKTGTAEKVAGRAYRAGALLSSFIGAFPIDDPRYVMVAMIDEPKPNSKSHGYATGGWVAAPAIARVVERMAPLVGIAPIDETNTPDPIQDLLVAVKAE